VFCEIGLRSLVVSPKCATPSKALGKLEEWVWELGGQEVYKGVYIYFSLISLILSSYTSLH